MSGYPVKHRVNAPLQEERSREELCVFGALLVLAVVGRWAEPAWHFTPLAAVTAFGGYYFRHWLPALLLPSAALALSDLGLPAHDNVPVLITVHMMMALPLVLGRVVRRGDRCGRSSRQTALWWAACGFLPATGFFLVTNFAVWAFQSDYPTTVAGLLACYVRGLPFYRTMLAGDLTYLALLLACWAAATRRVPRPAF